MLKSGRLRASCPWGRRKNEKRLKPFYVRVFVTVLTKQADPQAKAELPLRQVSSCLSSGLPSVGKWILLSDALALVLAFGLGGVSAWLIRSYMFKEKLRIFFSDVTIEQIVIFFGVGIFALLWLDTKAHYRQRLPYWEVVGHILFIAFAGLVVGGFIQFAGKNIYSRLWLGCSWGFFAAFLYAGRVITRDVLNRLGLWRIPAVMIGNSRAAQSALRALASEPAMGYEIVRVVPAEHLLAFEGPMAWRAFLEQAGASFLFLALEGCEMENFHRQIKALARERIPFAIVPPWQGLPLSTLSTHHFVMHDVMIMHDSNRLALPLPRLIKRSFDVLGSAFLLTLLAPVFAFLLLRVRADGGKAVFSQKRVGYGGKLFNCYKFRTMHIGADEVLEAFLAENPDAAEEWEKYQKIKDDPRITNIGRWLRKLSIDELPQLWNVLIGDMSLVGPRPFVPGQESYYKDDIVLYTSVRPGITGPWQVAGRNRLTFPERVALEAWYTRNWTFWLDIVILLKTIPAVLGHKETAF